MNRTPSEQGWTSLRVRQGSYPYPTEEVRERLQAWLAIFEEDQPAEEAAESPAVATDSPAVSQQPMNIAQRSLLLDSQRTTMPDLNSHNHSLTLQNVRLRIKILGLGQFVKGVLPFFC